MTQKIEHRPARDRRRRAAVARVSARTLRDLEAALGPGSTPATRALGRRQVQELIEVADWRVAELPSLNEEPE